MKLKNPDKAKMKRKTTPENVKKTEKGNYYYITPSGKRQYVNKVECSYCGCETYQDKSSCGYKPFCSYGCRSKFYPRTEDNNPMWGKKAKNQYDRTGDKNPNWNGGKTKIGGYKAVTKGGVYRRIHRIKAQEALGRRLKKNEIVHHINMDKMDNRNKNLLVCDKRYHNFLHHRMQLAWIEKVGL